MGLVGLRAGGSDDAGGGVEGWGLVDGVVSVVVVVAVGAREEWGLALGSAAEALVGDVGAAGGDGDGDGG